MEREIKRKEKKATFEKDKMLVRTIVCYSGKSPLKSLIHRRHKTLSTLGNTSDKRNPRGVY